jgi:hypothetical protein
MAPERRAVCPLDLVIEAQRPGQGTGLGALHGHPLARVQGREDRATDPHLLGIKPEAAAREA